MISSQLSLLPADTYLLSEFPAWVTRHCNTRSTILEVGAGRGNAGYPALVRPNVGRLVGIDPDPAILENPFLDERYQLTVEEFAKSYRETFECIYALVVVEHVTNPYQFLSACKSLLRPGGSFFALTPNLWHYFGLATKLSASLGVEDFLLTRLVTTQIKEKYHFPTQYRLNDVRTIKRLCAQAGFSHVEFRMVDPPYQFTGYFPRLLKWWPRLWSRSLYALHLPQLMGIIMFKATKAV